jgi:HSP20 family molecular chaperone IbpA
VGKEGARMQDGTVRLDVNAVYNEDKNQYEIDVELPWVPKDAVNLKLLPHGLTVLARRGKLNYRGVYTFCLPVEEERVTAKYSSGLLTIEAPLKEKYVDAKEVRIN